MTNKSPLADTKRDVIAVVGKGGVGKTTCVAMMAKILSEKGSRLLVVDADPPISLTYALGANPNKTLGELRRSFIEDPRHKQEVGDTHIGDVIMHEVLIPLQGMDLLVLGQAEGPGCYCGINELLKYGIESLSSRYGVTLIDCEAGIEQINRRVINAITTLMMVSDPTIKGLRTASYLKKIANDYGVQGDYRTGLLINKAGKGLAEISEKALQMGLDLWGIIPADDNIADYDLLGRPTSDLPDDSPGVLAMKRILSDLALAS